MYDYVKPNLTGAESSIVRPAVAANNFELKPNTIQMIQQCVQFDEFCNTFKINGVSDNGIRLRLFLFR
ncbi:RING-H2 finger protein ATL63 [Gossypium australe]|uniref:RING-H2 finger protein ATL63 n=1 Tax=Gossypium australe TaxID=47621 RepID=A0A5B6WSG9_9ROSI|nr:RING-H2 finger protein ATL63 [Gossypium australe]